MSTEPNNASGDTITVEGEITNVLPGLEYLVRINYNGIEHDLTCYVSGKMRTHFIELVKGDRVKVEISLYDINKGRIIYRTTQRRANSGPPRRPKK
jgi:translation initiation factor IF-1